jgi:alkanesulfonate monooxygenase SsuD/methylene tetrahydromethanopterin reductase-like flavin-dependent oxidoreductase (luciferase family)
MKQGFVLPGGTGPEQVELAVLADRAGWDGVFVWEGGYALDPWALLAAVAVQTERIRLGTMLTPLPWRRPWKLAGQVATVDQLSNGRAILAVGLGAVDTGLGTYPEVTDRKERAALLDRNLDIVRGLWDGETVFDDLDISTSVNPAPRPVQARIPIWVVAAAGRERSMRRALRCDGLLPTVVGAGLPTPAGLAEMLALYEANGGRPADVVVEGETEPGGPSPLAEWAAVGATWWLETRWGQPDQVRQRIEAGPVPSTG